MDKRIETDREGGKKLSGRERAAAALRERAFERLGGMEPERGRIRPQMFDDGEPDVDPEMA
jgi:hypothetical protein